MLANKKLWLITIISSVLFLMVGFFLWASSPNLNSQRYNRIIAPEESLSAANDSVFSIMTYNLGYLSGMSNNKAVERKKERFERNLQQVEEAIKRWSPDFLALQEIDFDSDRSFNLNQSRALSSLGFTYRGESVNWDKKYVPFPYYPVSTHFGKIISGQAVLSKYPILTLDRITLKRNDNNPFYYDSFYLDRLAQVAKIELNKETLVLINVHLEAYDKPTRDEQISQVITLYHQFANDYPTILLGDFNSDLENRQAGIKRLLELDGIGCAQPDPTVKTFDSESPTLRLDYIFYNRHFIEEVAAEVPDNFNTASDHLPLFMRFKFKKSTYGIKQLPTDTFAN